MDDTYRYRVGDIYMTSTLSVVFVVAFVCLQSHKPRSKQRLLQFLLGGWAPLEIIALILSSIHDFSNMELPQVLGRSIHLILVTLSMCGLVNVQVSGNLHLTLAFC
jgi:hypothetical protein